jgi:two-component system, LytTR family, sensor kinase
MLTLLRFYIPRKGRGWYILAEVAIFSFTYLLLARSALTFFLRDQPDYLQFVSKTLTIRFLFAFLLIGFNAVLAVIWYGISQKQVDERRKIDAEQLAKDAELYKLRQQLQPHFLFNSLNSINALIGSRPTEARKMVMQLSDFLRGTMRREEQQWISLDEELQHLQLYLDIEKVRFGNRLSTAVETGEECLSMRLPAMLLQPLVENAIKFGLYDTTGLAVINISAACHDKQLVIEVQNPYDPETADAKKGTGFGLNSVNRRLELLFARHDLLQTNYTNSIFTTTVIIPQQ